MSTQTSNAGSICKPGLPFQLPNGFKPGDFLYGENGPWPCQPRDDNACKVAPEVLLEGPHCIPQSEFDDWTKYLYDYLFDNSLTFTQSAIEYSANLLDIPLSDGYEAVIAADIAAWYVSERPVDFFDVSGRYPSLGDSTFTDMIAHGLLSKLMSGLDPADESIAAGLLNDPGRQLWKCDLTHMRVVRNPLPGEYVAPSIVYLSRPLNPPPGQEYDFRVEAIRIFVQSQPGALRPRHAARSGRRQGMAIGQVFRLAGRAGANQFDRPPDGPLSVRCHQRHYQVDPADHPSGPATPAPPPFFEPACRQPGFGRKAFAAQPHREFPLQPLSRRRHRDPQGISVLLVGFRHSERARGALGFGSRQRVSCIPISNRAA